MSKKIFLQGTREVKNFAHRHMAVCEVFDFGRKFVRIIMKNKLLTR